MSTELKNKKKNNCDFLIHIYIHNKKKLGIQWRIGIPTIKSFHFLFRNFSIYAYISVNQKSR